MLLSPSALELAESPELAAEAGTGLVPRAWRAEVEQALFAWKKDCEARDDNVAVLYVAGHGIELNKDDGVILLLADFDGGRAGPMLANALDTGNVRRGMTGSGMPNKQFYFVDACRVQPAAANKYSDLAVGVRLDVPKLGGPSSSPMYFSAASGASAYGLVGKGTYFEQALRACLDSLAAEPDATGAWRVTESSLIEPLRARVAELSGEYGQQVLQGGVSTGAEIHRLRDRPVVDLRVEVDPAAAIAFAKASVRDGRGADVVADVPLDPPAKIPVPAGLYTVRVRIDPATPPYKDSPDFACVAEPPRPRPDPVVIQV